MTPAQTNETRLSGFITERHMEQAEAEFPGITLFFQGCQPCPRTFLDLVALFCLHQNPRR